MNVVTTQPITIATTTIHIVMDQLGLGNWFNWFI